MSSIVCLVLSHCWFGDRKDIWPVKIPEPVVANGSSFRDLWGPGLAWSVLRENRLDKQKLKVICYLPLCWVFQCLYGRLLSGALFFLALQMRFVVVLIRLAAVILLIVIFKQAFLLLLAFFSDKI